MRSPAPQACPCSVVDITLASGARNPSSNLGRGARPDFCGLRAPASLRASFAWFCGEASNAQTRHKPCDVCRSW